MEASPELKALNRQCCEAQSNGDDAFFERHFSAGIANEDLAGGTPTI